MATTLHTEVVLQPTKAVKVKTQVGQHYKIRLPGTDGLPEVQQVPDNVIATREGDALQLRYPDGSTVTFEDFYNVCKDASTCSVNVAGSTNAGVTLAGDTAMRTSTPQAAQAAWLLQQPIAPTQPDKPGTACSIWTQAATAYWTARTPC